MATGTTGIRRAQIVVVVGALVVATVLAIWLSRRDSGETSSGSGAPVSPAAGATSSAGATGQPSSEPTSSTASASPDQPAATGATGALETVPVGPVKTQPPVSLNEPADFGDDISVRLVDIESVKGVARGPGEIAGPSLRVTFRMVNDSAKRLSLNGMVCDVAYGRDRSSAPTLSGPGVKPFGTSVAAGDTATGTYVFAVPLDERDRVFVTVSYRASQPTVVLRGSAA